MVRPSDKYDHLSRQSNNPPELTNEDLWGEPELFTHGSFRDYLAEQDQIETRRTEIIYDVRTRSLEKK